MLKHIFSWNPWFSFKTQRSIFDHFWQLSPTFPSNWLSNPKCLYWDSQHMKKVSITCSRSRLSSNSMEVTMILISFPSWKISIFCQYSYIKFMFSTKPSSYHKTVQLQVGIIRHSPAKPSFNQKIYTWKYKLTSQYYFINYLMRTR